MTQRPLGLLVALAVWLFGALAAPAEVTLVMVEEDGCIYCARWRADVGPEYPISPEGRAAPLRLIDLHEPIPEDLTLTSRPRLTPTFILVRDGQELSRLEGYPGEDFFWGLLGRMLQDAGIPLGEGTDQLSSTEEGL